MKTALTFLIALTIPTAVIYLCAGLESHTSVSNATEGAGQLKVKGKALAVAMRHTAELIRAHKISSTAEFEQTCKTASEESEHVAFSPQVKWWETCTGNKWDPDKLAAELDRRAPEFE